MVNFFFCREIKASLEIKLSMCAEHLLGRWGIFLKFLIKFKLNFKLFKASSNWTEKEILFRHQRITIILCNDTVINFFLGLDYTLLRKGERIARFVCSRAYWKLIKNLDIAWYMEHARLGFLREFMLIPIPDGEPRFYRNINLSVYQPLCKM